MNIKDPSLVLDEISREQMPLHLNLLPGILEKIEQRRQPAWKSSMPLRLALIAAAILVLVALASQPAVASALKRLVGFIPGIGVVDQSVPLRVLAGPANDARGGYEITVDSAVLDANRTVLDLRITGQFPTWEDPSLKPMICQEYASLVLPDGKELTLPRSEGGLSGDTFRWQMVFGPVPVLVDKATLVFPCLPELPVGEGPQDWHVPLAFVIAPPETTVYPLQLSENPSPDQPDPFSEVQEGLTIGGFAALDDGYFLQAVLTWKHDPTYFDMQVLPDSVHLFDSAGNEVPLWQAGQERTSALSTDQSLPLNLQTGPILTPGPVRLVVDYVGMTMSSSASFILNVGDDPQPGQTWQVNQDLDVNGHHLRVLYAEYIQPAPDQPALLLLYLEAGPDVLMVTAMDTEHEIFGTAGSPNSEYVPFRAGWHYQNGFPTGSIHVEISTITVRKTGEWSVEWLPSIPGETSTAPPAASLSQEQPLCQDQATAFLDALPAGLNGRVTTMEWNGEAHIMYLSNLDGSDRTLLATGIFPDLSPDGKRAVYRGDDDGLHVRDLISGGDKLIPGTIHAGIYDNWPRWSPDGQQIAFERVTGHAADIYLMNADGSGLRAIIASPEEEHLLNWSPDSRYISFIQTGSGGSALMVLDLEEDRTFETNKLPEGWLIGSLSPDGKRLLYATEGGLFLYTFITDKSVMLFSSLSKFGNQIHPIWSPDGQWVAVTYWETEGGETPKLALLQPNTCQLVSLDWSQSGWLSSWVKE